MGGNEVVIVQILAVVLILFFCFVTYMNTKTWRATQVTFLFLVFGAAMVFSVYSSLILKTRKAWQKVTEDLDKRVGEEKVKANEALYGKRRPEVVPGVAAWREAIKRTLLDRGRVWRDLAMTSATPQAPEEGSDNATVVIQLRTSPADDRGEKRDWTKMAPDTVVYAFKDMDAAAAPHSFYLYLGEYRATATTETSITLTSTSPMTPFDQGALNGNQPWILYERMPADSQEVFKHEADHFQPAVKPGEVLNVAAFNEGGILLKDPELHKKLFQETLWEYERDGMTEQEVDADRAAKGQVPLTEREKQERLFAKVKFLKEHSFHVDAPQAAVPDAGNTDVFDTTGQALDPRLRRKAESKGEVKFEPGKEAEIIYNGSRDKDGVIIEKGARELAEEGVLEISSVIYRRPLNDYTYAFRHIYARHLQITEAIKLVDKELAVVAAEIAAAEKNNKARQEEQGKLADDKTKLAAELQKIKKYADDLDASYRGVRSELSRLYRENAALRDRIVAANEKLTREIESRPTSLER